MDHYVFVSFISQIQPVLLMCKHLEEKRAQGHATIRASESCWTRILYAAWMGSFDTIKTKNFKEILSEPWFTATDHSSVTLKVRVTRVSVSVIKMVSTTGLKTADKTIADQHMSFEYMQIFYEDSSRSV